MRQVLISAFSITVAALTASLPARADAPSITGRWQSAAPEAQGQIFVTREFKIEPATWSVAFRAYGDASAKAPLFTLNVGGVYVLGGSSSAVAGAREGIFPATYRRITAESEAGVQMFAAMGCALKVRVVKPLTSEPCGFVPSLMQAMGEYDLVAVKSGQLFFGDRSGDLTKARPTALYAFPLIKR